MNTLALHGGTPVRTRPFPSWPLVGSEEREGLQAVLEAGIWSSAEGPKVTELEQKFAAFHEASHGVAVMSGTIALEIALGALGIGSGDEVIVPSYTFLATATAVLGVNALPIFVDIDPETYNIDPAAVEAAITPRTKAIIPVHFAGHPADMDRLKISPRGMASRLSKMPRTPMARRGRGSVLAPSERWSMVVPGVEEHDCRRGRHGHNQ